MEQTNSYNLKIQGIEYETNLEHTSNSTLLEYYIQKDKIYLRFLKEEKSGHTSSKLFICIRGQNFDDLHKLNNEELKKFNHTVLINNRDSNIFNLYLSLPNFPINLN